MMELSPHPRLYIGAEHYAELRKPATSAQIEAAQKRVRESAEQIVAGIETPIDTTSHNWHLIRARYMQRDIVNLLTEYKRSGERRFRDKIIDCIRTMAAWEYWSWITWRRNDPRPEAIFDLSYGENAATLAIAFDGLRSELQPDEVSLIIDTAQRRAFHPYLALNTDEKQWWYSRADSNWNTVCNGGAGMLALALYELCPEAPKVLDLVETGVAAYFNFLKADGAWPEGVGYWNYGMRYGFMYLLSHERATGRPHPLMERPETQATLSFPLALAPHGVACSFGDQNKFNPIPFHYAAAERYQRWDIIAELDRRQKEREGVMVWPHDAEILLLHPRSRLKAPSAAISWKTLCLMEGLEWGYVADKMPDSSLYASIRGGTLKAPHVHADLMSFFCVVGKECLIDNVPVDNYYDTTFGSRRFDLYEIGAPSKNTILINGVGIALDTTVATQVVETPEYKGFRIDATAAMGDARNDPAAKFCGRVLLLVKNRAVLVIDRVESTHAALIESRLHTFSSVDFETRSATVRGKEHSLHIAIATTQDWLLKRGMGTPTEPDREPDTMIRMLSTKKVSAMTIAYLLTPDAKGTLELTERGDKTILKLSGAVDATIELGTQALRIS